MRSCQLVGPPGGFETAADELVILAYQVWYLAPSLPVRSLLKAHPESVRERDVLSLIACRNMWYSAVVEVSGLLRSAGARRVDVVAATDTRRSVNDAGDDAALAADWKARTVPVVRSGRCRRRRTRQGCRGGTAHRRVPTVSTRCGARRARLGCSRPHWPAGYFANGAQTVRSARRIGSAAHAVTLVIVRAGPGDRYRGRSAADRSRGARGRCAFRRDRPRFRLSPDLFRPVDDQTRWRSHDGYAMSLTHERPSYQELSDWLTQRCRRASTLAPDTSTSTSRWPTTGSTLPQV